MEKWKCSVCDYEYDPVQGDMKGVIAAGRSFEELPDEWFCPNCGVGKEFFEKQV